MLREMTIENLAVIERARIVFDERLNVLTGETGAGKSILIGGINAIMGQRMSRDLVRAGEKRAVVTALFDSLSPAALTMLEAAGFEAEDGAVLLQREIAADGRTTVRIGGRLATNALLRGLGELLIAIHGQHDGQQLLQSERHMEVLDSFGRLEGELAAYQERFRALQESARKLSRLKSSMAERAARADALAFQIEEIESIAPEEGEEEALQAELRVIREAKRILDALYTAHSALDGTDSEDGACALTLLASEALEEAEEAFDALAPLRERLADAAIELEDIRGELSSLRSSVDADPGRLDAIEERLSELRLLRKKYGATIPDVLAHLDACRAELAEIENFDDTRASLEKERAEALRTATEQAHSLSRHRAEAGESFASQVGEELAQLDMPGVRLEVLLERGKLTITGMDTVEFLISANVGEPPKPMAKIASGGELSRIMLALKAVLADRDDIPTLIFDEIDTGVSGRAAQKIGRKMAEIAKHRQVLCVTHLAQIAVMADHHLLIEKGEENGRTLTRVLPLDFDARAHEIARILGGASITKLLLQNAEEQLREAEHYRGEASPAIR